MLEQRTTEPRDKLVLVPLGEKANCPPKNLNVSGSIEDQCQLALDRPAFNMQFMQIKPAQSSSEELDPSNKSGHERLQYYNIDEKVDEEDDSSGTKNKTSSGDNKPVLGEGRENKAESGGNKKTSSSGDQKTCSF